MSFKSAHEPDVRIGYAHPGDSSKKRDERDEVSAVETLIQPTSHKSLVSKSLLENHGRCEVRDQPFNLTAERTAGSRLTRSRDTAICQRRTSSAEHKSVIRNAETIHFLENSRGLTLDSQREERSRPNVKVRICGGEDEKKNGAVDDGRKGSDSL